MKYTFTISVLFFCAVISDSQCGSQKQTEYDIPNHVTAENKALFIERAEKGKILYKLHCSGCHGIFTKGKDGVPNFTKIQIDNYHATALIGLDPNNHAVAKKMSSEQIDYIVTFLRLRKVKK
ncbi:MAG TPA: cytochrome c [Chitinophagaceae bacterium]